MRVSKIKSLEKRMLGLQATRRQKSLDPPYDCPLCEGHQCVQVTKKDVIVIFHCRECDSYEILPIVEWFDTVDYFCVVTDKWLADRYDQEFEEPIYEIEVDSRVDGKNIRELQAVSFGEIRLFTVKGGEHMPVDIKEAKNWSRDREARATVDWTEVIGEIIESGEYWSVKEIYEKFVKKQVKEFRTKTVLDKAVEDGSISRFWDKRRYVYGRNIE